MSSAAHAVRSVQDPAVSLGVHFVIDDLDDGSRDDYVLVSSAESNPAAGRLSDVSPVGRAVRDHRKGDLVDVLTPRGPRHLRIVDVDDQRPARRLE